MFTARDGGYGMVGMVVIVSIITGMAVHAKNKVARWIIPVLVLGFWDKNTRICAGAGVMPDCRDFRATTGV